MDQVFACLIQADKHLETISVRGADVYALLNARSALKAAYDELKKEVDEHVSNDAEQHPVVLDSN